MGTPQCLTAEIAYDPDPIEPQTDTSNSDKLVQRNLVIASYTALTIAVSPNPARVGQPVTITGTLTNNLTGLGVGGGNIDVKVLQDGDDLRS